MFVIKADSEVSAYNKILSKSLLSSATNSQNQNKWSAVEIIPFGFIAKENSSTNIYDAFALT